MEPDPPYAAGGLIPGTVPYEPMIGEHIVRPDGRRYEVTADGLLDLGYVHLPPTSET